MGSEEVSPKRLRLFSFFSWEKTISPCLYKKRGRYESAVTVPPSTINFGSSDFPGNFDNDK